MAQNLHSFIHFFGTAWRNLVVVFTTALRTPYFMKSVSVELRQISCLSEVFWKQEWELWSFFLFKKSKQKIQHKTKWTLVCNDWEMSFHRGSTIKEVYRSFEWMFINFVRYLCFPYQTILLWNKGKLWNKNYEELNFGLYSKTWVLRKVAISTVKCNMPGTKACFC